MKSEDYLKGYNDGYKKACEVLEGTSKGLDVPEATDEPSAKEIMDRMQKDMERFFEQITRLQGNLCQVERRVERLEK